VKTNQKAEITKGIKAKSGFKKRKKQIWETVERSSIKQAFYNEIFV